VTANDHEQSLIFILQSKLCKSLMDVLLLLLISISICKLIGCARF